MSSSYVVQHWLQAIVNVPMCVYIAILCNIVIVEPQLDAITHLVYFNPYKMMIIARKGFIPTSHTCIIK